MWIKTCVPYPYDDSAALIEVHGQKVDLMPHGFLFKTIGNHGTLRRITEHVLHLVYHVPMHLKKKKTPK